MTIGKKGNHLFAAERIRDGKGEVAGIPETGIYLAFDSIRAFDFSFFDPPAAIGPYQVPQYTRGIGGVQEGKILFAVFAANVFPFYHLLPVFNAENSGLFKIQDKQLFFYICSGRYFYRLHVKADPAGDKDGLYPYIQARIGIGEPVVDGARKGFLCRQRDRQ